MPGRTRPLRLVVLAGEASGDALGALLVQHLRPDEVVGIVGPRLRALGARPLLQDHGIGTVGVPSPRTVFRLARRIRTLCDAIDRYRPDVVVSIDSPAFNLRVTERLSWPRLHWVSPQVWAWRPGRVRRIARSTDVLATLFPFEPSLYAGTGLRVHFTGHPLADRPVARPGTAVGVLAGSRAAERRRLGPLFDAATRGSERVEVVPIGARSTIAPFVHGLDAVDGRLERALVCSGTATLELAAMGVPMVASYATDPVTLAVARRLISLPDIVLPNLILGRPLIPCILQPSDPEPLRRALDQLDLTHQRAGLAELRYLLRPHGAVARVADLLVHLHHESS